MKRVNQSVVYLPQEAGMDGVFKQIEIAGRTAYKSEKNITPDSARKFAKALGRSEHYACFEFGTIYLKVVDDVSTFGNSPVRDLLKRYRSNPYSRVRSDEGLDFRIYYITTTLRVICENGWEDDFDYMCEPTEYHVKRYMFRCVTNIHVYKDLTRHRKMSFLIESTRYNNYTKDKFNNELTVIKPCWGEGGYDEEEIDRYGEFHIVPRSKTPESVWVATMNVIQDAYFKMIELGWTPQQAANILPQGLKADMCICGYEDDWQHVMELRYFGTTGKPHPQVHQLVSMIKDEFDKLGVTFYNPKEETQEAES